MARDLPQPDAPVICGSFTLDVKSVWPFFRDAIWARLWLILHVELWLIIAATALMFSWMDETSVHAFFHDWVFELQRQFVANGWLFIMIFGGFPASEILIVLAGCYRYWRPARPDGRVGFQLSPDSVRITGAPRETVNIPWAELRRIHRIGEILYLYTRNRNMSAAYIDLAAFSKSDQAALLEALLRNLPAGRVIAEGQFTLGLRDIWFRDVPLMRRSLIITALVFLGLSAVITLPGSNTYLPPGDVWLMMIALMLITLAFQAGFYMLLFWCRLQLSSPAARERRLTFTDQELIGFATNGAMVKTRWADVKSITRRGALLKLSLPKGHGYVPLRAFLAADQQAILAFAETYKQA